MLKIDKFFLNNIRCFKDEKQFNIRPLTFLVGENSTGKSTVLGCINAIGQYIGGREYSINFNLDPFEMGSFENIVRRASPKNTEFELGFEFGSEKTAPKSELRITLYEQPNSATPAIKQIRLIFTDGEIIFITDSSDNNEDSPRIKIEERGSKKVFKVLLVRDDRYSLPLLHVVMRYIYQVTRGFGLSSRRYHQVRETSLNPDLDEEQLYQFIKDKELDALFRFPFRLHSFAPIRSKPQRTYDPLFDAETSYGVEIPVLLRNLYIKEKEKWNKLKDKLVAFGKSSGLFTDIRIRNLGGSSLSNPFQLEFKIRGAQARNLIDVGYGISQILPIVTRVLMAGERKRRPTRMLPRYLIHQFLMQQPEVHLHPKAQAALTSLLVELTKTENHCFIIETHSDFMIDRARIEIMQGNIKPEDVSLIYLEAKKGDVEVYNLCFDSAANFIKDPPANYADFFMSETHKLLGWDN